METSSKKTPPAFKSLLNKINEWSGFQDPLKMATVARDIVSAIKTAKTRRWPKHVRQLLENLPREGVFMTGIESSDPFADNTRRDQLKEAHNFYERFSERLEKVRELGITWVRFGPPYSQTHLGRDKYDFSLMDKVVKKATELGITIIADLLHFGLPDWLHEENAEQPFFQNPKFPYEFAKYADVFARRYPQIHFYTPVNEPFVTANFSAKLGMWNERRSGAGDDDRAFVLAVANIARAAILARQAIEKVWTEQQRPHFPVFIQNESLEKTFAAAKSGREPEARRFNLRRFAALDLIFGHNDRAMKKYLLGQGLAGQDYDWFMRHGSSNHVMLGIDHYPWCIHILEKDKSYDHSVEQAYQMYYLRELVIEYYERYKVSLIHTEINAWPEYAAGMCLLTYDALSRLRKEGYPIVGMTWYGDEYQVGWHQGLVGPKSFEETPVGLYYKGQAQPVAEIFREMVRHGFTPLPERGNSKLMSLLSKYLSMFRKE